MAVEVNGTLNIIERNGSRGAFNVAELVTDIGAFNIKHPVLDQFFPGSFTGQFIITKIYNKPNQWRGQVFINLYADLDWAELEILAQSDVPEDSETLNMQGMVEQTLDDYSPEQEYQESLPVSHEASQAGVAESEGDVHYFIEHGFESIKLDDCLLADRPTLGKLKNILRQHGYIPHLPTQTWRLK